MSQHEWRYCQLKDYYPNPWQAVLACWDYSRQINCPTYRGVERRRGVVLDVWRGPDRWLNLDFGAAYTGYYEIPELHDWECPVRKIDGGYYLVYFDPQRIPDPVPKSFFMAGSVFIAKFILQSTGFDWFVVPNVGDRRFTLVPFPSVSKWHPLDMDDSSHA